MTPAWISDSFAALMLAVAAVSAARLVGARPWGAGRLAGTDVDAAHLLMAIAMAGMLAASLRALPNVAWEIVFGLMTAWFAVQAWRGARANGIRAVAAGHCTPHLVHSAAMLYMLLALVGPARGPAMQALEYPTLAFIFALILVGYSIWDLGRFPGRRPVLVGTGAQLALAGPPALALRAPGTLVCCQVVMGITMAYMLVIMI
jgi:hypothetical protein